MGNLGIFIGSKIDGDLGMASSSISNRGFSMIVESEEEEKREALREGMVEGERVEESDSVDLLGDLLRSDIVDLFGDLLCGFRRFSKRDIFLVNRRWRRRKYSIF